MNGDDTFDEIQRVDAGLNSGWIQTIGPMARVGEFKQIETTRMPGQLQQLRWPPTKLAGTPAEARQRLFMLPGAHYDDPQFSWRYAVAPAGIGFVRSFALGPEYLGDLFVGAATPTLEGGYLFRFNLTRNRRDLDLEDPMLTDRVADNSDKHDITESQSLLAGRNFGVSTDIQTGPHGHLFVVSISRGEILEVSRSGSPSLGLLPAGLHFTENAAPQSDRRASHAALVRGRQRPRQRATCRRRRRASGDRPALPRTASS